MKVCDAINPRKKHAQFIGFALLASALLVGGCASTPDNLVQIQYEQIVACNGLASTPAIGPQANFAYMVYRLLNADNPRPQAQDFQFDPSQIFVNNSGAKMVANVPFPPQFYIQSQAVAKGTDIGLGPTGEGGYFTVKVPTVGEVDVGNQEAAPTNYHLLYNYNGTQPVLLASVTAPDTAPVFPSTTSLPPLNICAERNGAGGLATFVEDGS
jgi:hypothetical protein